MHFRSLLTVELLEITPDPEWEKTVSVKLREAEQEHVEKLGNQVLHEILYQKLNNISTTFGRELNSAVCEVMERFDCGTQDKRYLVFEDHTEEYFANYNELVTCIQFPNGRIVEENSRDVWGKFIVKDGLVYQKYAGPLRHPKRTKRVKKMKALKDYPRKRLYQSFDDYVDQECRGSLDEETGKYGEWYNPDGVYDWYSVGGRWPDMFLVKADCKEFSLGERSVFRNHESPAPDGYIWVCCARKKDIDWDVMRWWHNQKATERFHRLQAMFVSGEKDDTVSSITEEGIMSYGEWVYHRGDTLAQYLAVYGIPSEWKYPISVHNIFQEELCMDKHDCVMDKSTGKWIPVDWRRSIDEFIDEADEDDVFVGIDYHI